MPLPSEGLGRVAAAELQATSPAPVAMPMSMDMGPMLEADSPDAVMAMMVTPFPLAAPMEIEEPSSMMMEFDAMMGPPAALIPTIP